MAKIEFNNDDDFRANQIKEVAGKIGELLLETFSHDARGFANIFTTITLVAHSMAMTSSLAALLHRDDVSDEEIIETTLRTLEVLGRNISDTDNITVDLEGSLQATRAMMVQARNKMNNIDLN